MNETEIKNQDEMTGKLLHITIHRPIQNAGWPQITEYVLRRKKDGWFIIEDIWYGARSCGLTSDPDEARVWNQDEISEALTAFGLGYEIVRLNDAKEVE